MGKGLACKAQKEAKQATKVAQEWKAMSLKESAKSGARRAIGIVIVEMAWNGYKLGCEEINVDEFKRLTVKSIGRNALSVGSDIVATQTGAGTAYALNKTFG